MDRYDRPLAATDLRTIVERYSAVLCGTASMPPPFPPEFIAVGAKPRDGRWNGYRGMTSSQPEPGVHVFGFTYDDWKAGETDEEHHVLNEATGILRHYPRGRYERENPLYAGTHRGPKPYLPPATRPPGLLP